MKSAFELAMERLGGTKSYSDEQMAALAEISRKYDAKRAEATLGADERIKKAKGDKLKIDEIRTQLSVDLKKIAEKEDAEKSAVRGKK